MVGGGAEARAEPSVTSLERPTVGDEGIVLRFALRGQVHDLVKGGTGKPRLRISFSLRLLKEGINLSNRQEFRHSILLPLGCR